MGQGSNSKGRHLSLHGSQGSPAIHRRGPNSSSPTQTHNSQHNRAKASLQRRWATSIEYASLPRRDWRCAVRLTSAAAPLPHSAVEDRTQGRNVDCSTFRRPHRGTDSISPACGAPVRGSRRGGERGGASCGSKTHKG